MSRKKSNARKVRSGGATPDSIKKIVKDLKSVQLNPKPEALPPGQAGWYELYEGDRGVDDPRA